MSFHFRKETIVTEVASESLKTDGDQISALNKSNPSGFKESKNSKGLNAKSVKNHLNRLIKSKRGCWVSMIAENKTCVQLMQKNNKIFLRISVD